MEVGKSPPRASESPRGFRGRGWWRWPGVGSDPQNGFDWSPSTTPSTYKRLTDGMGPGHSPALSGSVAPTSTDPPSHSPGVSFVDAGLDPPRAGTHPRLGTSTRPSGGTRSTPTEPWFRGVEVLCV